MQAITLWKLRNALANISVLGPVLGSHSCPLDGSDVSQILKSSARQCEGRWEGRRK